MVSSRKRIFFVGEGIMFSVRRSVDREVRPGACGLGRRCCSCVPVHVGAGLLTCSSATNISGSETSPGGNWWPASTDLTRMDTEGTLEQYRRLDAQVLLMYGSKTPIFVGSAQPCTRYLRIRRSAAAATLRLFFAQ